MTAPWWVSGPLSASLRRRIRRRRVLRYFLPVISPYSDRLRERAMDGHRCTHVVVQCAGKPLEGS